MNLSEDDIDEIDTIIELELAEDIGEFPTWNQVQQRFMEIQNLL